MSSSDRKRKADVAAAPAPSVSASGFIRTTIAPSAPAAPAAAAKRPKKEKKAAAAAAEDADAVEADDDDKPAKKAAKKEKKAKTESAEEASGDRAAAKKEKKEKKPAENPASATPAAAAAAEGDKSAKKRYIVFVGASALRVFHSTILHLSHTTQFREPAVHGEQGAADRALPALRRAGRDPHDDQEEGQHVQGLLLPRVCRRRKPRQGPQDAQLVRARIGGVFYFYWVFFKFHLKQGLLTGGRSTWS
jgi:hypothetical protein